MATNARSAERIAADNDLLLVASGRAGDWAQRAENDDERDVATAVHMGLVAAAYDIESPERAELIRFARAMMGIDE